MQTVGRWGGWVILAAAWLASISESVSDLLSVSRVALAMGEAQELPRWLGEVGGTIALTIVDEVYSLRRSYHRSTLNAEGEAFSADYSIYAHQHWQDDIVTDFLVLARSCIPGITVGGEEAWPRWIPNTAYWVKWSAVIVGRWLGWAVTIDRTADLDAFIRLRGTVHGIPFQIETDARNAHRDHPSRLRDQLAVEFRRLAESP